MNTAVAVATGGIEEFKSGVDALLEKRRYFIEKVLPTLIEGKDYFSIKGHRSLGKAGAEKLASLYQLVATFEKDTATMESFKIDGLVAYKCTLSRNGVTVAESVGAAVLGDHQNNVHTTIRLCEKRCFVGAIIRGVGCSDFFTSDLEDLPEAVIQSASGWEAERANIDDHDYPAERSESERVEEGEYEVPITERQREYLHSLASQNLDDGREKEEYLANIETLSKSDACSAIKAMLASTAGR